MIVKGSMAGKITCILAVLKIVLLCGSDATGLKARSRERRTPSTLKSVTASVRATVILSCDTAHRDYDLIEWKRNDSNTPVYLKFQNYVPEISPSYSKRVNLVNGKDLEIQRVSPNDQSVYYCKTMIYTSSTTALETGSKIRLTVQEAPSCKGNPGPSITGVVNSSIVLPCQAAGSPFPTITWSKNDGRLPYRRYSIIASGGLRIQNLKDSDSGNYQVTLKNDAGQFAHVIDLIVRTSASVIPGNYINAKENVKTTVPCGKGKVMEGATITWTRHGADVTKSLRFTVLAKTGGLLINTAKRDDSGLYQCSVKKRQKDSGAIMTLSHQMYLNVQFRPVILEYARNVAALGNSTVVLDCVTNGNPVAKITWLKEGKNITYGQRYSMLHNGSLQISNLEVSDDGVYTCAPYNRLGFGGRGNTEITVLVPPVFLTNQKNVSRVRAGGEAIFDCRAVGKPAPNVTWYPLGSTWPDGRVIEKGGFLTITDVHPKDYGKYRCGVSSMAGLITKDFTLIVICLPQKPKNLSVVSLQSKAMVTWLPGYDGGSKQIFQIWYRLTSKTDFEWDNIKGRRRRSIDLKNSHKPAMNLSSLPYGDYYFTIRAINEEGAGPFSDIVKVNISGAAVPSQGVTIGPLLSERPLPPVNITLNITADGYFLTWKTTFAPGRPDFDYFVVETKPFNSSFAWKNVGGKTGKHDKKFFLSRDDIDTSRRYVFRIFAVAGKIKSQPDIPSITIFTAMPEGPTIPAMQPRKGKKTDPLAAIIIGCMFAIFVFILVISLVCFIKDSRRRRRAREEEEVDSLRKDNFDVIRTTNYCENDTIDKFGPPAYSDIQPLYQCCSKQKRGYHSKKCPNHRLKLGNYENGEFQGLLSDGDTKHGVHIVFSESPEKCECARRKYMSLPRRVGHVKKARKVKIYKSSSSPSVFNHASPKRPTDEVIMLPEQILNEEEFDLSDVETDVTGKADPKFTEVLSKMDPKFSTLRKANMLDSYDQFCRSTSEFGSKDVVSLAKKQSEHNGNGVDFYMSPNDDNDSAKSSERTSSPSASKTPLIRSPASPLHNLKLPIDIIEEKSEERASTVESDVPDRGSKENIFDDPNDASSENSNSVTENDHREPVPLSPIVKEAKPGTPTVRYHPADRLLTHRAPGLGVIDELGPSAPDTRSLDSNDQHSIRSFELRSSGFDSGAVSQASTSDTESVTKRMSPAVHHPLSFMKFRDPEAMSDISARSSPGPVRRSPYSSGLDEPYEWDWMNHRGYRRPYAYTLGRRRHYVDEELTNNDDLFKQMIEIQKKLGVNLDDSLEELNMNNVYSSKTPLYRDGYTSDVPMSMNPYTEHEKSRRCERLLREFKTNKYSTESLNRTKNIKRSSSSLGDYARQKGPVPPPYHRSTSAGGDSVYREWLV